jgi:hypothetical protein
MVATKKRRPAARTKRARQQFLPLMAPPSIPKIDKLADEFFDARQDKQAAAEAEKTKGDLLWAAMRQEGLARYEYPGGVVELEDKHRVKVTKDKAPPAEADGDGEQ